MCFRKLKWLFQRRGREADLHQELAFHLEEETENLQQRGLAGDAARRAALRDFGNVALHQERTRSAWRFLWWEQLAQDIRYALRAMAANKTFAALAVLSMALGIGANTAIFSFMDSILLRSLPVRDPQSLAMLGWHTPAQDMHGTSYHDESFDDPKGGFIGGIFAYPAFELLQHNSEVFSSVFGYQGAGDLNLTFRGQAVMEHAEYVSGAYFDGLGTSPSAGRLLTTEDDRAGAPALAVISHALSERRFGGPANATGQSIVLDNVPFTVVGVTAPEFFGADPDTPPDVYLPMHTNLLLPPDPGYPTPKLYVDPQYDWVTIMARLRPGVTVAQAQAAVAGPFYQWGRASKPKLRAEKIPTLVVRDGGGGLDSLRRRYSKPLYILLALVALILAIACANIANLLLSRAAARKREIAVRMSMGAARSRVVRQLLTESVLLSALGGAAGIAFAVWGIRVLTLLLGNGQEEFTLRAGLNWRVLGVATMLSLVTGVLFGLAPALHATRIDLAPALKESRTGERRRQGVSLSRVLMAGQIAFALLILVAAGLFTRTLSNLGAVRLGFNSENLLTFRLDASQSGHKSPEISNFYTGLQKQFASIPGVQGATLSIHPPAAAGTSAGDMRLADGARKNTRVMTIGSDFFHTLQIPILLGRPIDERDRLGAPMVAVVNQAFARLSFGELNPVGRHMSIPSSCDKCDIQIVGLAADSLYGNIKRKMGPIVYLPYAQEAWRPPDHMYFELRTVGNPLNYAQSVRAIVHRADPRLPVAGMATQRALIDESINQEIVFARLCTAFALLALAIACVGLYGAMSYNVARRTGEIGIRMALGAPRAHVLWMVQREVGMLAAVGLAISLPAALLATKVVKSFLFGMEPNDPLALSGAVAILVCAAIVAGYVPARRASRIDPMTALRHE